MNSRWIPAALVALAVSSVPGAEEEKQQKLPLRHHWEVGKVYHFQDRIEWEVTVKPANVSSTLVTMEFDVTVKQEPGSERKLAEVRYLSTKAITDNGGVVQTYDSAHPEASSAQMRQEFGGGPATGGSITLVYDQEDHCVDTIVPDGLLPPGVNVKGFAESQGDRLDTGLPKEGLAVGDKFPLSRLRGSNSWGPIKAQMDGSFESIVPHEGRRHAKIVMQGVRVMVGQGGADVVQPGSKDAEEVLFDLARQVMTRRTMTESSNRPPGNVVSKSERTLTLKGISEAKVAAK